MFKFNLKSAVLSILDTLQQFAFMMVFILLGIFAAAGTPDLLEQARQVGTGPLLLMVCLAFLLAAVRYAVEYWPEISQIPGKLRAKIGA